jgi:pimeloyl-ACP methyl ester carboxylesterase
MDDAPTRFAERDGVPLAYVHHPGTGPTVVFLGGFRSDMTGTKALALEAWARARGRAFLRLDYAGHGQSGGTFEAGTIGGWRDDAVAVIREAVAGSMVLVGSSMGGWIALLIARAHPQLVAGLVTVAAAPDFTEDGYWSGMTEAQRVELVETGHVDLPSDEGAPYRITHRLIEQARDELVLRAPLRLPFPVRMLQGTDDAAVSATTATRLLAHAEGGDMRLTFVKGSDHRFSSPRDLAALEAAVDEVCAQVTASG